MLNISGSLYLTDNKDLVYKSITDPMKTQKCMCLDMDEQDNTLGNTFPNLVFKATVLLPPPSAIFREIDGDNNGFIQEYIDWLMSTPVTDFIASILLMLTQNINVIMYTPSFSEDSLWINKLLEFFQRQYGIHVGTSAQNGFAYDNNYDTQILTIMYLNNCIDEMTYVVALPMYIKPTDLNQQVWSKLTYDLYKYGGRTETPVMVFDRLRGAAIQSNQIPKTAILFEEEY